MTSALKSKSKSLERLSLLEETSLNLIVNEFAQVTSVLNSLEGKITTLKDSIKSAEDKLRDQHSYGDSLKFGFMDALRAYINEQSKLLEQHRHQKKRAQDLAENINIQLVKSKNKLNILNDKHGEVVDKIDREKEKSRSKELDDMWLQRRV